MTEQERVLTLWADANPIRNADVAELERDDSATYLATLTQRSSEMTKLEPDYEAQPAIKPSRRGWVAVAAAAVAVLVIGVGYQFLAESDVFGSSTVVAEVRFDGEECVYEGPSTFNTGDVEFTFHNDYLDGRSRFDIFSLHDGKDARDLEDYLSASGLFGLPPWGSEIEAWRSVPAGESQTRTVTFSPGVAHMVCTIATPYNGVIGGELLVTD